MNNQDMMSYYCEGCGELEYTENEDDLVTGLCVMCQEYGIDHVVDRSDGYTSDYCQCEDYPCCGH